MENEARKLERLQRDMQATRVCVGIAIGILQ